MTDHGVFPFEAGQRVEILRLPLTSPCPVPVLPGSGRVLDDLGDVIPLGERTELCAVDAGWMLGAQRLCDVHLRESCDLMGIDFDGVITETFEPFGHEAVERARERARLPWGDRHRYTQDEARSWDAA